MYLHNKYTRYYFNIIEAAQIRELEPSIYIEKHHILPKSLGGTNKKDNIVKLMPREHFVCHLLLTKMLTGENKAKMVNAALRLANDHNGRCINSRIYMIIKQERSKYLKNKMIGHGNHFYGKKHSDETRAKMSLQKKGTKLTDEQKQKLKGRIGPMLGKTHSLETRKRLSEFGKTRTPSISTKKKTSETMLSANIQRSTETKEKMRRAKLGIVHPRKICEYCGRDCAIAMYTRWHGNNCKLRVDLGSTG